MSKSGVSEFSVESHVQLLNHAKIISNNENSVLVLLLLITKKIVFLAGPGRATPNLPGDKHQFSPKTTDSAARLQNNHGNSGLLWSSNACKI